jgi:hypothetical protein
MDCVICFNTISNACILTCTHHFCYSCIHKWCYYKNTCPKCRAIIYDIKFDKEFDTLINGGLLSKILNVKHPRELKIEFPKGVTSGVTLKNCTPGVRVSDIDINCQFYKHGIKVNDIILLINNMPCMNHSDVVDIINNHQKSNLPIILHLK